MAFGGYGGCSLIRYLPFFILSGPFLLDNDFLLPGEWSSICHWTPAPSLGEEHMTVPLLPPEGDIGIGIVY